LRRGSFGVCPWRLGEKADFSVRGFTIETKALDANGWELGGSLDYCAGSDIKIISCVERLYKERPTNLSI
jgi:hypothetical protein